MAESTLSLVFWAAKGVSICAVVIQALEFLNDFIDEIEHIWRKRIRFISCLYAWSRYFPLIVQVINLVFSEVQYTIHSSRMCMVVHFLKGASVQLITSCFEAILMIRVHALYKCSQRSGNFLLCVFLVGTTLEIIGTAAAIGRFKLGTEGTGACVPAHCSFWPLCLSVVGWGLVQSVLLFMTLSKIVIIRGSNWNIRVLIISLMLRDGITFFIIIAFLVIASVLSFAVVGGLNEILIIWNAAFSWYLCLISTAGCRMILGMRRLRPTSSSQNWRVDTEYDSTLTQFSTTIDIDEPSTTDMT